MTAPARARFLGTGQRVDWVGLQRTVQPLKVFNSCTSSSPSPFFVSTAGFGAWVSTTAIGRIAFPGAVDDTNFACDLGTPPCSVGPPANAVRWCFKASRVTITIAHGSPAELLTAHARAVGLPRAPWLPQLGLIKWRDRISGAGRALRRHRAASLARHPGRLGAARQPVGAGRGDRRLLRRAQLRLEDLSRPQGDDQEDPRPGRPLHALDLAAGPPRELRLARLPRRLADGRRQDGRPRPHDAEGPRRLHPPAAAARRARRRRLQGRPRRRGQPRVEHAGGRHWRDRAEPASRSSTTAPPRPRSRPRTGSSSRRSSARPSPARRRCCRASSGPTPSTRSTASAARSARRRRRASPACPSGDPTSAATPAGS